MDSDNVFKVVSTDRSGLLRSARILPYQLYYSTEKITVPLIKNSKLFIFSNLFHALYFLLPLDFCYPEQIWRIKATNCINAEYMAGGDISIPDFWKYGRGFYSTDVPDGTLFCDSVQLIERVV